jgi:hypothetical protein
MDPREDRYSRTECVYSAGPPGAGSTTEGNLIRYRNLPYVGILTDDGDELGINRGAVDIDLNRETGTGTIRGSLAIRDRMLGYFDGHFEGEYRGGMWEAQGSASGRDRNLNQILTVDAVAFDPSECPAHPDYGVAIDAAVWSIFISAADD